jgi:hypothetical protein
VHTHLEFRSFLPGTTFEPILLRREKLAGAGRAPV